MVEILVIAYLILGLMASLVIWAALKASKRPDQDVQNMTDKPSVANQFSKSKAKEIELNSL